MLRKPLAAGDGGTSARKSEHFRRRQLSQFYRREKFSLLETISVDGTSINISCRAGGGDLPRACNQACGAAGDNSTSISSNQMKTAKLSRSAQHSLQVMDTFRR
jgi:hypothetical protein